MTKVMLNISDAGDIYFDCINHAGDHDVCTIISSTCNMLVEACFRAGYEPNEYNKGHVHVEMSNVPEGTLEVYRTGQAMLSKIAKQHPEHVRIY